MFGDKKRKIVINSKKNILVKKILFISIQLTIMIFFSLILLQKSLDYVAKSNYEIISLIEESSKLTILLSDVERKAYLVNDYMKMWNENFSKEQREIKSIDIENIRQNLLTLSNNNYITNIQINFVLPQIIKNLSKNTINFFNSENNIKLNSMTEYSLYYFLKQLEETKIGFFLIEEFSITRIKNLDKSIINNLINGKLDFLLESTIKLQWFKAGERKK